MKTIVAHTKLHEDCLKAWNVGETLFVLQREGQEQEYPDVLSYIGQPSLIMLSSGTTGKSKPIVIPWEAVKFRCQSVFDAFGDDMEKTALLTSDERNYFFARELTMAAGLHRSVISDPKEATCAIFFGKGYIDFEDTLRKAKDLRLAMSAGFSMTNKLWHDLKRLTNAKVITRYGATEVGSITRTDGEEVINGNVGKPLNGVAVRIKDGEVQVKTPGMAAGYIGRDFPLDEGWYKTGDQGWIDDEGNVHIQGRKQP